MVIPDFGKGTKESDCTNVFPLSSAPPFTTISTTQSRILQLLLIVSSDYGRNQSKVYPDISCRLLTTHTLCDR